MSDLWLGLFLLARVEGDSLEPTLGAGDVVLAIRLSRCEVRPGEIVLFRTGSGRLVVKRVVRQEGSRVLLGVEAPYGWVSRREIVARVVWQSRRVARSASRGNPDFRTSTRSMRM